MSQKSTIIQILYIILYITISSIGLLLVKLGSGENRFTLGEAGIGLYLNTKFIAGLLLYAISFCLFTFKIVTFAQLNTIYPICVGLGLTATFVLSIVVLHEAISAQKIIAFVMILVGCVLISVNN